MAPRKRPKVGLTRTHAALDAMRLMGFSTDIVRKCLKKLLKVYGDDGWVFIEEASYKLLIETILEEPEVPLLEPAHEQLLLEAEAHSRPESTSQPCDKEDTSEADTILHGPEPTSQPCDKEDMSEVLVCADTILHGPEPTPQPCDKEVLSEVLECADTNLNRPESTSELCEEVAVSKGQVCALNVYDVETFDGEISAKQEKNQDKKLDIKVTPIILKKVTVESQVGVQLGFAQTYTPQARDNIPTKRKCQPCYGWISDDDEVDDLMEQRG